MLVSREKLLVITLLSYSKDLIDLDESLLLGGGWERKSLEEEEAGRGGGW